MSEVTRPTQDSTRAWLGHILRMEFSRSNFYELNPAAAAGCEIDHFFEVQHVVSLLLSDRGTVTVANFHEIPLGFWIDLSVFINRRENLYKISKNANQLKKNIPWAKYAPGQERHEKITQYLGLPTGFSPKTVEDQVKELAVSMAKREGPWGFLTRQVGYQICAHMGWKEGTLHLGDSYKNGDFNEPPWMLEESKSRG